MPIDDRTANLSLALPNASNTLLDDVARLRSALTSIDSILFGKATPADITAAISVLTAGAPAALDTLNELAAAINDDASYAATITTALGNKLDKTTIATAVVLGLIKQGVGVTVDGTGVLSLNIAGVSALGGVKVGSGLAVAGDGTLSVSGTGVTSAFTEQYITPTAGQTTFTISGGYNVGQIEFIKNGVTLYGGGDDYTASNGTTIVLNTAAGGYVAMTTADTLLLRKWAIVAVSGAIQKTGDTMSGAFNEAPAVTVASAGTTDIANAAANSVTVSGTATITALGTVAAGAFRRVTFSGAATLTHNATSLILPGAANITTSAGDVAEFVSLGTGNWRCTSYSRATGAALVGGGAASSIFLANYLGAL